MRLLRKLVKSIKKRLIKPRLIVSCAAFHAGKSKKWKYEDYPRGFLDDVREILNLTNNKLIFQNRDKIIETLLFPVADPRSLFGGCYEGELGDFFLAIYESRMRVNSCFYCAGLNISIFAAYLKRSGDFVSAIKLYNRLTESKKTRFVGYLGLGDIHHLLAKYNKELDQFRSCGAYPTEPFPEGENSRDLIARLGDFSFNEAIDHYLKAISVCPDIALVHHSIGLAYRDSGLHDLAADSFLRAFNLDGLDVAAQFRAALLNALHGSEEDIRSFNELQQMYTGLHNKFGNVSRGRIFQEHPEKSYYPISYKVASSLYAYSRSAVLSFEKIEPLTLNDVRELGLGLVATSDGGVYANRKHLGQSSLEIFSPNILSYSSDRVILGFPRDTPADAEATILPGAYFNYFHFLFESLSAVLLSGSCPDVIATETPLTSWQKELFSLSIGRIPETIKLKVGQQIRSATALPLPARFNIPSPQAVGVLRSKLSRHAPNPTSGKRIFLTRKNNVAGRKIRDEHSLQSILSEFGVETHDTGLMSVSDQIELFKDAELVVGLQGAAFSNLIFCPSSTVVIGIASPNHHFECFTAIASFIGQKYILCLTQAQTIPRPFFIWSTFDMEIDLMALRKSFELAEEFIKSRSI